MDINGLFTTFPTFILCVVILLALNIKMLSKEIWNICHVLYKRQKKKRRNIKLSMYCKISVSVLFIMRNVCSPFENWAIVLLILLKTFKDLLIIFFGWYYL